MNRVWILGAPDPEMELIEKLLRECGETVVYALDDRGERVHPGNAYRCPTPATPEGARVYAVECIGALPEGWVRIDHHRPGDPGHGRPPEEFLAASSVGQVLSILAHTPVATRRDIIVLGKHPELSRCLLTGSILYTNLHTYWHLEGFGTFRDNHLWSSLSEGNETAKQILNNTKRFCFAGGDWYAYPYLGSEDRDRDEQYFTVLRVPTHILLVAAADHCLAAAYAGECPGVDPEALVKWRAETRAAHQGRSADDVLADVERARYLLRDECPRVALSLYYTVIDARRIYKVPELSEAAFRDGKTYITTVVDRDGREKVVLGGCTTPEVVRAFMEQWAPGDGLEDIYGDPERGFAGGYLSESEVAS